MSPTLLSGDLVLVCGWIKAKVGDVVVVNTEQVGLVIKRLIVLDEDTLQVVGDNPASDSPINRIPLPRERLEGKVVLGKEQRRGLKLIKAA